MPFVGAKKTTEGVFYPYGREIAEMSKEVNVILSDIVSIAAQQGFGQATLYYDTEEPPAITKSGPTNLILIPNQSGNSKFEFANANPDLQGHLDIALSLIRLVLTTNDLTSDKVAGELNATNFASAIDRLIADSETIVNIEDQRKRYITIEKKQFRVVLKFLEYMYKTKTVPEDYPKFTLTDISNYNDYDMRITYNSMKPIVTEKERATTIYELEEKGFIEPWEKHVKFSDGRLSEKEAKLREESIRNARLEKEKSELQNEIDNLRRERTYLRMSNNNTRYGGENADETDSNDSINRYNQEGQAGIRERKFIDRRGQEKNRKYNNRTDKRKN
jgi:hypothetical protein